MQAGAGDAAQPVVCTDCFLQKPSALHWGCKLPLVSKDQHSPFLLSTWRSISGRAGHPRFPHRVIDYTLPLRRVDWFPGARKMIDEYFRPWASLPAGCSFHMSPMGLGTFFKTRKCHFYGYHPVIGTVHWAEALCKSKWNTKGQLKCLGDGPNWQYQVSRKTELGKEKPHKAAAKQEAPSSHTRSLVQQQTGPQHWHLSSAPFNFVQHHE